MEDNWNGYTCRRTQLAALAARKSERMSDESLVGCRRLKDSAKATQRSDRFIHFVGLIFVCFGFSVPVLFFCTLSVNTVCISERPIQSPYFTSSLWWLHAQPHLLRIVAMGTAGSCWLRCHCWSELKAAEDGV